MNPHLVLLVGILIGMVLLGTGVFCVARRMGMGLYQKLVIPIVSDLVQRAKTDPNWSLDNSWSEDGVQVRLHISSDGITVEGLFLGFRVWKLTQTLP